MEPLRGWEPPPWSLTPKADALHQVSPLSLCVSVSQGSLATPQGVSFSPSAPPPCSWAPSLSLCLSQIIK
uniref:Uncharacterized protein n=1 Tax=Ailuropoda melanoleuca TaxID=9646 RepID=A0A7N5K237_AILME